MIMLSFLPYIHELRLKIKSQTNLPCLEISRKRSVENLDHCIDKGIVTGYTKKWEEFFDIEHHSHDTLDDELNFFVCIKCATRSLNSPPGLPQQP